MVEAGTAVAVTVVSVVKKAVDVAAKLKELIACVKGKGEVSENGKGLLEKITVDLQSVLNSLNSHKEKTLYQEHIEKLNGYLNRLVNEINAIVGDDDWKSKASRFAFKDKHLEKLSDFSQELERMKSTLHLAVSSQIARNQETTNEKLDKNQAEFKVRLEHIEAMSLQTKPTTKMVGIQKDAVVAGVAEVTQTGTKNADVVLLAGMSTPDQQMFKDFIAISNTEASKFSEGRNIEAVGIEGGANVGSAIVKQSAVVAGTVSMQQNFLPKPEKQRKKKKGAR